MDYLGIDDVAFFVNGGFDQHLTLRVSGQRRRRILRLHALDHQALRYALGNL